MNLERIATENTILSIIKAIGEGKRTLKSIAAECRIFEEQSNDDYSKAAFARLSDCKTREDFWSVLKTI
nr:MAG: hypothetical protein [Bacteriophage sp.]UVX66076.1 MAG: hypothetical protein [Bacteriophage sp.]